MEKQRTVTKSEKDLEEFIKQNKDILYKRTSQEVGSRVNEGNKDDRKAIDGKFTKHLASSGMYRFNGLNTVKDKEKVVDGSKDWMLKLV